jgi:hypothetical protein
LPAVSCASSAASTTQARLSSFHLSLIAGFKVIFQSAADWYAKAAFALALPWQLHSLISIIFRAGLVNQLFVFNLASEKWVDIGVMTGDPAPARYFCGFVAAAGKLYVHAGMSGFNDISSKLLIYLLRVYDILMGLL